MNSENNKNTSMKCKSKYTVGLFLPHSYYSVGNTGVDELGYDSGGSSSRALHNVAQDIVQMTMKMLQMNQAVFVVSCGKIILN